MSQRLAPSFTTLGPWSKGMVIRDRLTEIPPDGLADVVNADVREDGSVVTRNDWDLVLTSDAHSFFSYNSKYWAVVNNNLCELTDTGANVITNVVSRLSWSVLNGKPIYTDGVGVFEVDGSTVRQLTVSRDDFDFSSVLIDMPGGQYLGVWNGRVVVARGASLLFSQPLRYGAHNPLTDYIEIRKYIEWLAPLETGIFFATEDKVYWLEGASPDQATLRVVAGKSAPAAALVVPSSVFGQEGRGQFVVFFTQDGFAVGAADGTVTYPQAGTIQKLPLRRGRIILHQHRLFFVVEA